MRFSRVEMFARAWSCPAQRALVALSAGAMVLAGSGTAHSAMKLETCKARKTEHASLVASGVPDVMAKGPEWAKANLGADRLGEILKFIQLEEDLKFRCDDVFAEAEAEAAAKARAALQLAAKRAGVEVPPMPTKNPDRQLIATP